MIKRAHLWRLGTFCLFFNGTPTVSMATTDACFQNIAYLQRVLNYLISSNSVSEANVRNKLRSRKFYAKTMSTFVQNVHIKDGEYTKTIYTMVHRN